MTFGNYDWLERERGFGEPRPRQRESGMDFTMIDGQRIPIPRGAPVPGGVLEAWAHGFVRKGDYVARRLNPSNNRFEVVAVQRGLAHGVALETSDRRPVRIYGYGCDVDLHLGGMSILGERADSQVLPEDSDPEEAPIMIQRGRLIDHDA